MGPTRGGERRSDVRVGKDRTTQRPATLSNDRTTTRCFTTCVATQLDRHAPNVLPQRATATLSCRVMQGTTAEQVKATLKERSPTIRSKLNIVRRRDGSSRRTTDEVEAHKSRGREALVWRAGAPQMAGATDGRFFWSGIPTYGVSGTPAVVGE
jgi:acetylornithine deacetylase/succinyl-diaminopimelate desuccinylase-like protein